MRNLCILLVEDEPLIAMLLEDVLAEQGHMVCATEATQAGAVAAALRHQPDLMLVDAGLASGSGVAAVEEILRTRAVPHIFITGGRLSPTGLHARAVVMQKPFRDIDLAGAIEQALAMPVLA